MLFICEEQRMNLKEFFSKNKKVAIAFSGGVDSVFLLQQALKNKAEVRAYYVKSDFQPEFEFKEAKYFAHELGADLKILEVDVLKDVRIEKNDRDRCYFCKQKIFGTIIEAAKIDGFDLLLDGTNASDEYEDRPGMRAKEEMKVLSPLRECNLTKSEIRELSKKEGLASWKKPSYSCLATRIKTGMNITKEDLAVTEKAEAFLMNLGFKNFRVRKIDDVAKIEVTGKDFEKIISFRKEIVDEFKKFYREVTLNLEVRDEE